MKLATAAVASLLMAATRTAAADDGAALLDAPAPPTMPALTTRELTYTFEYTVASIEPNVGGGRAYAWSAHNQVEVPIVPRKWYVGLAGDTAAASVPGVGSAVFVGNPELWARGVWSSVTGLSSGGGLGLVLPVPRDLGADDDAVLRTLRVVRPWDAAYFDDLVLTARPSFDIRHVVGRVIFQMRQGIDFSLIARDLEPEERRTRLTARATFYVGYRVADPVGVGLELWEVYQLTATDVEDDERAAFAVSPSIRLILPRVQPALSALFPIATPLRGDVQSYFGARLNVGFTWDIHAPRATEPHARLLPEARAGARSKEQ